MSCCRNRLVWAGAVLLLLAVGGCMTVEERRTTEGLEEAWCANDSECFGGLVCHTETNLCVLPDRVELEASIRLTPPTEGMLAVEEHYPLMALNNQEPVNLKMHRPIRVVGRVLVQGAPLVSSEQAHIVAVADGETPGLNLHQSTTSLQTNLLVTDGTTISGYELRVLKDKPYDIYVHLSGEDLEYLPPHHVRRSFSPKSGASEAYLLEWDIEIPSADQYVQVTGILVAAGAESFPLVAAKVVGFSEETGNITSTAITDEQGHFTLLAPPTVNVEGESYTLTTRPSLDNELVPGTSFEGVMIRDDLDLGQLTVSSLAKQVSLNVLVADDSGIFTPQTLGGTVVRFSGGQGEGDLLVERTVSSESQVQFNLPEGIYVLSVIPPAFSTLGIQQELVQLDKTSDGARTIQVSLQEKPRIHGWVLDSEGGELSEAHVVAIFTGKGIYPDTSPLASRKMDTYTDQEGHYELFLDSGQYTLLVEPPTSSGLPRQVVRNVFVSASQQRTMRLSAPIVVSGTISGYSPLFIETPDEGILESWEFGPAQGVRVELYSEAVLTGLGDETPVPTAVGWTDSLGHYSLIVPADSGTIE